MKPLFVPLLDNGNGQVMASFMIDHIAAFRGREIEVIRASDSHANRGMNKIANAFLESECDIWINIDADIRFRKADIDRLLSHNLPLVYGLYPKKQDDTPPCICTFAELPEPDANGLAVVRRAGRGFMLVHRRALEAMKEDNGGPALRYHNHEKVEWDFFPSGVVTGEMSCFGYEEIEAESGCIGRKREWISEDWYFCERARACGFATVVDTEIALGHVGQREYRFDGAQVTRMDSNIKSWREIDGWFDFEELYRQIVATMPTVESSFEHRGRFVEVGCFLGRSTAAFAEFARETGKRVEIHAIDTFEGTPASPHHLAILQAHGGNLEKQFQANMAACGLNGELVVHVLPSTEAAKQFQDRSLDAVFIDADHRKEAVLADIEAWARKVKPGGILAGHDYDEEGVKAAVDELLTGVETVGRCWKVKV